MAISIRLTVDGSPVTVTVEPSALPIPLLREPSRPSDGGAVKCGTCTVHLDGGFAFPLLSDDDDLMGEADPPHAPRGTARSDATVLPRLRAASARRRTGPARGSCPPASPGAIPARCARGGSSRWN
ncbi:hypothetical protein CY652_11235 [Burkholderia sp. WAC0059]|uniref:hypothetical protein n=1 Tax=Burkholderia sp. WAC0059 TaxID=2066022 RepID=UPI000C7F0374|nr:hypothetical protein [Burkholderia sp. WAC0059]PLZ02302.1 hypothetical protein CY652_11235 [Burkholderia sp. WAC0059]